MNDRSREESTEAGLRSQPAFFNGHSTVGSGRRFLKVFALGTAFTAALLGQARNFDARTNLNAQINFPPLPEQSQALDTLGDSLGDLSVSIERTTGATRSLWNRGGFLTDADSTSSVNDIAAGFLAEHATALGLTDEDVSDFEVTDSVFSQLTGATHLYLRQTHQGLPVYNGQVQFNVNRDGRIQSVNNAFLPDVATGGAGPQPSVTSVEAAESASEHLGLNSSLEPLAPQLMWLGVRRGQTRLVWNFQLDTSSDHYYDFTVDAQSGQVWTKIDWVADATYRVYAQPIESPNHTSPAPPADGRTLQVDPQDGTASPFGWHDTNGAAGAEFTGTRGNNVHAYPDTNANNIPDSTPDCGGSLSCDFAIDLTQAPSAYTPAATANLFYWNNIIHDIQYQYGFDEAAGNFQVNNYGNGGASGDDVRAEAQDGGGNCNANFFTPSDSNRPRMQMYTCTNSSPLRDGDLDNAVIVHEYGHGISNRQVGGPANVGCLGNIQQPGEGWSDWLALAYTAETGDAGTDSRGMGTYLFGQAANGPGIRNAPYSTDFGINNYTYSDISGVSIPHGVGFVWATILWEAYWELVNHHGFGSDLYDANGNAGNQRMMLYVNEGMKNTSCSPTFLDARDGVIQAAEDATAPFSEDVCLLWAGFARRGLGVNATTNGPNSRVTSEDFDVPPECGTCTPTAEVCDDGVDNDCDDLVDCADIEDCNDNKLPPEDACFDQLDNDCDGNLDCFDTDCQGGTEVACFDTVDNDCDLLADCLDTDCQGGPPETECADQVDNDCDTLTDCDDIDDCGGDPACAQNCTLGQQGDPCDSDLDCCTNKCRGGQNKTCKGDFTCTPTGPEICNNGSDDDCDGKTDCADLDCSTDQECATSCEPDAGEPCVRDSDCCSNNCSNGKPATRVCEL